MQLTSQRLTSKRGLAGLARATFLDPRDTV